jgi:hypothetical protein
MPFTEPTNHMAIMGRKKVLETVKVLRSTKFNRARSPRCLFQQVRGFILVVQFDTIYLSKPRDISTG